MALADGNSSATSGNSESTTGRRTPWNGTKTKTINFKRSRGQLHLSNVSNTLTSDLSMSSVCYTNPSEDPVLKLKLINLVPTNAGKESSEGVREIIKHVSDFIGKKNSPKDGATSGRKEKIEVRYLSSKHSMRSYNGRDPTYSSRKANSTSGDKKTNKTVQRVTAKSLRDTVVSPKSEPKSKSWNCAIGSPNKNGRTKKHLVLNLTAQLESAEKKIRDETIKTAEGDVTKPKNFHHTNQISSPKENHSCSERRVNKTEPGIPGRSPTIKKSRPSEIPLRKNRTDFVSKTKDIPPVTRSEIKTTTLLDANTNQKTRIGGKIEPETQFRAEMSEENLDSSSSSTQTFPNERFNYSSKSRTKLNDASSEDVYVSRWTNSTNIPKFSDHTNKAKTLDLEQVRSSTFTVLRKLSHTLHRLEFMHQQNVGIKENGLGGDKSVGAKPSKLNHITTKSSFNLLKAKGSKKSLSSRLSSKGNKPALKIKRKKSKTELERIPARTFQEYAKRESPGSEVQKVGRTVSAFSEVSTSKNSEEKRTPNLSREKRKDGPNRFSGTKANTSKDILIKDQGDNLKTRTSFKQKLSISRSEINYSKKLGEDFKILERAASANLRRSTPDGPELDFNPFHEDEDNNNEHSNQEVVTIPQSNFEDCRAVTTIIERKRSYSILVDGPNKIYPVLPIISDEQHKTQKPETVRSEPKPKSGYPTKINKSTENNTVKDLRVKGTPVKIPEDKTTDKPEEEDSDEVKLTLMIDTNSKESISVSEQNPTEDGLCLKNSFSSFNWLFMNYKTYEEQTEQIENPAEVVDKETPPKGVIEENVKDEFAVMTELDSGLEKHYIGTQVIMRRPRPKSKTPVINGKTIAKKMKTRSDNGDRWLFTTKGHSAINFQNKTKAEAKLRSGLTRSFNRDTNIGPEKRDHFEDNGVKLKRRNSEPYSFRGFIWRAQDAVPTRGNKASASSLASSLKHLNTDDMEDFIFWESVPSRMTSCWEMSLYHFKRPWTVLSCSVFKDNRLSNTPGLILENIRNGNCPNRSRPVHETERVTSSFDVEPSITQKNIDIRNWLAALNFQSPPSTSSDVTREGNFTPQTVVRNQDFKNPVSQKRRKVVPGLKFSESNENKNFRDPNKYNSEVSDVGLMELIRRKSGGFVTAEQYFNSDRNSSEDFQVHRKPMETKSSFKSKSKLDCLAKPTSSDVEKLPEFEPHISREEKMIQVVLDDLIPTPSREIVEEPSPNQLEADTTEPQQSQSTILRKFLRDDRKVNGTNVWKYLFLFTLFLLIAYCATLSRYICRM